MLEEFNVKLNLVTFLALLTLSSSSFAECSSNSTADSDPAARWLADRTLELEGRTFKHSSYQRKFKCTATRELKVSASRGNKLLAHYKMLCGGQAWADAEVEIKPKLTHWTDKNNYSGQLNYETVYTSGFSGVADLKNETKAGTICFLPAGRIEYDGDVYEPAQ